MNNERIFRRFCFLKHRFLHSPVSPLTKREFRSTIRQGHGATSKDFLRRISPSLRCGRERRNVSMVISHSSRDHRPVPSSSIGHAREISDGSISKTKRFFTVIRSSVAKKKRKELGATSAFSFARSFSEVHNGRRHRDWNPWLERQSECH